MIRNASSIFALLLFVGCSNESRPEKSSVDPRQRLLDRIGDINDVARPRPLVTLEEFFEGNSDPGSIGYNLPDPPEPKEFYDLLKRVRNRADVSDVRITVMDHEDPEGWPSTDTIWIITSASPTQVRSWFPEGLAPDEVWDGFDESAATFEAYEVPGGMRAVGAWYDCSNFHRNRWSSAYAEGVVLHSPGSPRSAAPWVSEARAPAVEPNALDTKPSVDETATPRGRLNASHTFGCRRYKRPRPQHDGRCRPKLSPLYRIGDRMS